MRIVYHASIFVSGTFDMFIYNIETNYWIKLIRDIIFADVCNTENDAYVIAARDNKETKNDVYEEVLQ